MSSTLSEMPSSVRNGGGNAREVVDLPFEQCPCISKAVSQILSLDA